MKSVSGPQLAVDSWQLAVGSWQLAVGKGKERLVNKEKSFRQL